MFERILKQIREKIRTRQYVLSIHSEEEMDDDNLNIFDVERCILTGEIIERQKDQKTSEWKYLVRGQDTWGEDIIVVCKLSPTGKLVIITIFLE